MIRKLLLTSAFCLAACVASAQTVTLNWTSPAPVAPNPVDLVSIQIWDQPIIPGLPAPNTMIGSVSPAVKTFKTGVLAAGVHQFTAVAVYGEGSAPPSNVVSLTVSVTLAPVTGLTGTVGP